MILLEIVEVSSWTNSLYLTCEGTRTTQPAQSLSNWFSLTFWNCHTIHPFLLPPASSVRNPLMKCSDAADAIVFDIAASSVSVATGNVTDPTVPLHHLTEISFRFAFCLVCHRILNKLAHVQLLYFSLSVIYKITLDSEFQ